MKNLTKIARSTLLLAAASSMAACSSGAGISLGGGGFGYAPPKQSQGCSPSLGTKGSVVQTSPNAGIGSKVEGSTSGKPARVIKPPRVTSSKPARVAPGSSTSGVNPSKVPNSGC